VAIGEEDPSNINKKNADTTQTPTTDGKKIVAPVISEEVAPSIQYKKEKPKDKTSRPSQIYLGVTYFSGKYDDNNWKLIIKFNSTNSAKVIGFYILDKVEVIGLTPEPNKGIRTLQFKIPNSEKIIKDIRDYVHFDVKLSNGEEIGGLIITLLPAKIIYKPPQ